LTALHSSCTKSGTQLRLDTCRLVSPRQACMGAAGTSTSARCPTRCMSVKSVAQTLHSHRAMQPTCSEIPFCGWWR
jgi:hypothetical protein